MVAGVRGSLPLQVLVYNHRYYITAAVFVSLLAFIYKGECTGSLAPLGAMIPS